MKFEFSSNEEAAFIIKLLANLPNESNAYMLYKMLENQFNTQLQAESTLAVEPPIEE